MAIVNDVASLLNPRKGVLLDWDNTAMTALRTSDVLQLPKRVRNIFLRLSWSGGADPDGEFTIKGSDDSTYWEDLEVLGIPKVAATPGDILINLLELNHPYLQVVYTFADGTGTLASVHVTGKLT